MYGCAKALFGWDVSRFSSLSRFQGCAASGVHRVADLQLYSTSNLAISRSMYMHEAHMSGMSRNLIEVQSDSEAVINSEAG